MPVSFGSVPPFLIRLVLVMPVVPVAVLPAVPDKHLPMRISTKMIVCRAMLVKMKIWLRLIHHFFVTMVKIEIVIAGRKFMREGPVPPVQVDELMVRNIIVCLNVRDIIVFHVIISNRTPGWLLSDIDR
jgi:hypothetical protein